MKIPPLHDPPRPCSSTLLSSLPRRRSRIPDGARSKHRGELRAGPFTVEDDASTRSYAQRSRGEPVVPAPPLHHLRRPLRQPYLPHRRPRERAGGVPGYESVIQLAGSSLSTGGEFVQCGHDVWEPVHGAAAPEFFLLASNLTRLVASGLDIGIAAAGRLGSQASSGWALRYWWRLRRHGRAVVVLHRRRGESEPASAVLRR